MDALEMFGLPVEPDYRASLWLFGSSMGVIAYPSEPSEDAVRERFRVEVDLPLSFEPVSLAVEEFAGVIYRERQSVAVIQRGKEILFSSNLPKGWIPPFLRTETR